MERIGIDEEAPKNFNQMVKGKYEQEFRDAIWMLRSNLSWTMVPLKKFTVLKV